MNDVTDPLHIVSLEVENTKRVKLARVRPDGALVIVGGKNAQGKSSVLDAIEMALGGTRTLPPEPIRRGARKARQVLDLGAFRVERTITSKGTVLVVTAADGSKVTSPQTLLDSLLATVSFDPAAFARLEPKKQDEVLKQLVPGLAEALAAIEAERARLFDQRTETKRKAKALAARVDAAPRPEPGIPAAEVSASELFALIEHRRELADGNALKRHELACARGELAATDERALEVEEEIARLKAALADEEQTLGELAEERLRGTARVRALESAVSELVEPDLDTPKRELAELEVTNRKVRAAAERGRLEKELDAAEAEVEELTRAIEHYDEEKAEAIAKATFPVPGLGFDETGVTFNGVPLEQASQAERLRVSVAIGAALNPRLRVMLVREGSLLDAQGLELLATLAKETQSQVWLERVSEDGAGCSVFLEDGETRDV